MKKILLFALMGGTVTFVACNKQEAATRPAAQKNIKTSSRVDEGPAGWGRNNQWIGDDVDCKRRPVDCYDEIVVTTKNAGNFTALNLAIAGGPVQITSFFNGPGLNQEFLDYWENSDLAGLLNGTLFVAHVDNPAIGKHFYFVGNKPSVSAADFNSVYQFIY